MSDDGEDQQSPPPQIGEPVEGLDDTTYNPSRTNDPEDLAYEVRVTGIPDPDISIDVDTGTPRPVELDWFIQTPDGEIILVDAKNAGEVRSWFDVTRTDSFAQDVIAPDIEMQARRQVEAMAVSGAAGVEWIVPDQRIANALQQFFDEKRIDITVTYVPRTQGENYDA